MGNAANTTGERFIKIADVLYGGNRSELARNLGINPSSFSKYTSGDIIPGGSIVVALDKIGVNPIWLITGGGEMMIDSKEESLLQVDATAPSWDELILFIELACKEKYSKSLMYEFIELKGIDDHYANTLLAVRDTLYDSDLFGLGISARELNMSADEYMERLIKGRKVIARQGSFRDLFGWGKIGATHEAAVSLINLLSRINIFKKKLQ